MAGGSTFTPLKRMRLMRITILWVIFLYLASYMVIRTMSHKGPEGRVVLGGALLEKIGIKLDARGTKYRYLEDIRSVFSPAAALEESITGTEVAGMADLDHLRSMEHTLQLIREAKMEPSIY